MATATLSATPVGGALGARVDGIDLRRTDEAQRDAIHELLLEHLVLVFPGQHLDDAEHLRFALAFGDFYAHPIARVSGRTEPGVGHIVDDADHPPFQDQYHTDVSWDPQPPTFGVLRMIDRPQRGGDTIFTNMYLAYDRLSDTMKQLIEPLRAWHDMGAGKSFRSKSGDGLTDAAAELVPGAEHPVVGVHPITKRKYLYVNRAFTRKICGLNDNESKALLDMLCTHSENRSFELRWNWSLGDVVLWDERCTMHYAVADHYPQRRETGRVNVVSNTL